MSGWTVQSIEIVPFEFSDYNLSKQGADAVGGRPPPPPPLHACQHLGLCVRAGALLSAPDDPWPVNPASPDVERFNAYLWAQGVNLVIT